MIRKEFTAIKRLAGLLTTAVLAVGLAGAVPAHASEPWWHLTSGAAPTILKRGQAKDEVQEVTVSGTSGTFVLVEKKEFKLEFFAWNATSQEVQEGLERVYGAGNVEVSGGPGDEEGTKPYVITFTGELASQPVEPIDPSFSPTFLGCQGAIGTGCRKEATFKEAVQGRSDGQLLVTAANLGDEDLTGASTPVTIADRVPSGLTAVSIEGQVGGQGGLFRGSMECSLGSLSCTFAGKMPPYEEARIVIGVDVDAGAKSGEVNEVLASGGNAPHAKISRPVSAGDTPTPFGVEDYEMTPEEEGGAVDTQAGSHPFQLTTTLDLNRKSRFLPAEQSKDLIFALPPGLIGNPTPVPQCTLPKFLNGFFINECPNDTAVGTARVTFFLNPGGEETFTVPLFNLTPSVGEPARFGFMVLGNPVFLDTSVRTGR